MKTIYKMIGSVLAMTGFIVGANAQSTATASTTAILVTPIAISKTTDMHFGTVAASGTSGTVILATNDARTPGGGATLPAGGPAATAAVFAVTGEGTSTYSISVPSSPITLNSGGNSMTVGTFVTSPTPTGALTAGAQTLRVGATLNVAAGQAAGTYTNATDLFVTVNYN